MGEEQAFESAPPPPKKKIKKIQNSKQTGAVCASVLRVIVESLVCATLGRRRPASGSGPKDGGGGEEDARGEVDQEGVEVDVVGKHVADEDVGRVPNHRGRAAQVGEDCLTHQQRHWRELHQLAQLDCNLLREGVTGRAGNLGLRIEEWLFAGQRRGCSDLQGEEGWAGYRMQV